MFLYKGTTPIWRAGSWTGDGWSDVPDESWVLSSVIAHKSEFTEESISHNRIVDDLVKAENPELQDSLWGVDKGLEFDNNLIDGTLIIECLVQIMVVVLFSVQSQGEVGRGNDADNVGEDRVKEEGVCRRGELLCGFSRSKMDKGEVPWRQAKQLVGEGKVETFSRALQSRHRCVGYAGVFTE
ncbi:hypothetical protein L2E82_31587 [Cichorium intybus]|uniref:Uncharacterized protein n=1 Tax=Cichorium intybus TaxID=13427 RepID=A0ACB9BEU6_CICIN|nr:hypothetical protein L2E82_31587 [Cichorium intybus]